MFFAKLVTQVTVMLNIAVLISRASASEEMPNLTHLDHVHLDQNGTMTLATDFGDRRLQGASKPASEQYIAHVRVRLTRPHQMRRESVIHDLG